MAEMDTSSGGGHKKGRGVKKSKKLSTRVDLTPMVDLGFLLLTFFVFTTTLSQPTAMAVVEPKDDPNAPKTEVKESAATTFLLGEKDKVFYYFGKLNDPATQLKETDYAGVRNVILERKRTVDTAFMMFLIKCDTGSTFKNNIDILDEMSINVIPKGKFAEVKMDPLEKEYMDKLAKANSGQAY